MSGRLYLSALLLRSKDGNFGKVLWLFCICLNHFWNVCYEIRQHRWLWNLFQCKYRACSEATKYENKRLSSSAYSTKALSSKPTAPPGLLRLSNDFWLIVEVLYPWKIALASLVASLLITAGSWFDWKSTKSCIYSICLASTTACWETRGPAGECSKALGCWRAKARYFFSDAVASKTKILDTTQSGRHKHLLVFAVFHHIFFFFFPWGGAVAHHGVQLSQKILFSANQINVRSCIHVANALWMMQTWHQVIQKKVLTSCATWLVFILMGHRCSFRFLICNYC